MSSSLRVLILGRRFWPHGSLDNAAHLIHLASDLKRRGTDVEVVTPRYAPSWTAEFAFREIPVHRPAIAPRTEWAAGRYVRTLTKWLREHASKTDVILVDGAREEAVAAIDAGKAIDCPVIVRVGSDEHQSDLDWWDSSRAAQRCENGVRSAQACVVSGPLKERGLISRGFSPQRIRRIDVGFGQSTHLDGEQKSDARRALTSINRDFHAPIDEPVAFCVTAMSGQSLPGDGPGFDRKTFNRRIDAMVESARHLVARYPLLHLWFIGDGPQRDLIYETLRGDGVRASIAMPGSFAKMEDVFAAADVFVQLDTHGLDQFLPTAVAAELPIVAADLTEIRERLTLPSTTRSRTAFGKRPQGKPAQGDATQLDLVGATETPTTDSTNGSTIDPTNNADESLVSWFDPAQPKTFRQAMRTVLDDLPAAAANAQSLHRKLVRARPQTQVIDDYLDLFDHVVQQHRRSDQGPSMGAVS